MNTRIGKKIRSLRETKGITQEKMAEKLNMSRSAYGRIETGETSNWANYIEKLCTELEIRPEELFAASEGLVQNQISNSSAVQNQTQHDTHIIINHLSDKMIELYEEKIKLLEAEISRLKIQ
jgi:transcriptional regulator with XRE-family HTH domain